jgi:hypothetical protein
MSIMIYDILMENKFPEDKIDGLTSRTQPIMIQKQKLDYGNKTIEYSIIKSKRVKTSEIMLAYKRRNEFFRTIIYRFICIRY